MRDCLRFLACILYIAGLLYAVHMALKLLFYPSFSSFTFPFVISPMATFLLVKALVTSSFADMLVLWGTFQVACAACLVCYVAARYAGFFLGGQQRAGAR